MLYGVICIQGSNPCFSGFFFCKKKKPFHYCKLFSKAGKIFASREDILHEIKDFGKRSQKLFILKAGSVFVKKLILIVLITVITCLQAHAQNVSQYKINFDGKIFELKYSKKSPQTNTYINEYFMSEEKYSDWTELMGVYYFPKQKSPISYAEKFAKQVLSSGRPAELIVNEKTNAAILTFMTQGGKLPTKIELNIFKCEKSPKGGTIALQYSHRYFLNEVKDVESMNASIEKNRLKWINFLINTPMPQLVERDIDLGN